MRKLLVLTISSILLIASSVAAYASIPSSSGVVNGCYTTQAVNGVHGLGVIDSTGTCPAGTIPINWNQTGPQGPQGGQGDPGPTGATGPQGPAGIPNSPTFSDANDQTFVGNFAATGQWVQIAPLVGSLTITLSSPSTVFIEGGWNTGPGGAYNWSGRFIVDGSVVTPTGAPTYGSPITWPIVLSAGSHTVTMEATWSTGGCTDCRQIVAARYLTLIDLA